MCLKGIFRTFILTSVIFAIISQAQETENAERKECCAFYEDSAKKTAWLICGENSVINKTTAQYTVALLIEEQVGKTCHESVISELEGEVGQLDPIQRFTPHFASGTVLKLPSRAFSGFDGIKSFLDNDLLNVIESDAFEGSSVQSVSFTLTTPRALRFDDNAFRQKVSTIKSVTLNVNTEGINISSNIFKNFKTVSTITFSCRSTLTCPYLQYALKLEKFTFEKEDQPFSPCFLCGASNSTRLCLNEITFETNPKLSNLKESFADVTREEDNCLVLKPGMRFSQASACKNETCVAECSSTKPVQVIPTAKVGRKKKTTSARPRTVASESPATPTISKEAIVIAKLFTTIQVTSTPTLTNKIGGKNKTLSTSTRMVTSEGLSTSTISKEANVIAKQVTTAATSPTERRQTTQNSIDPKSGDSSTGKVSPTTLKSNRTKMANQFRSKDALTTNPSTNRSGSEPVERAVIAKSEQRVKSSRKPGDTTKDCNKMKTSALMVLFVTLIARSVGLNSFFG